MADQDGWVRIYRKLLKSAVFEDALTLKVWIWLLLNANWEERQLLNGTVLKPGELVISQMKAANELRTTRKKLRTCLERLKKCGNVAIKGASTGTHISISNWDTYQYDHNSEGPGKGPARGQRGASEGPENKNTRKKEGKNIDLIDHRDSSLEETEFTLRAATERLQPKNDKEMDFLRSVAGLVVNRKISENDYYDTLEGAKRGGNGKPIKEPVAYFRSLLQSRVPKFEVMLSNDQGNRADGPKE